MTGDLNLLLALAAGLAVAMLVLLFAHLVPAGGVTRSTRLRRRIAHVQRWRQPSGLRPDAGERPASLRRREETRLFGGLSARLARLAPRPQELRRRLLQAGLRIGVGDFLLITAGLTLLPTGLLLWRGFDPVAAVAIGLLLGLGLPFWYLHRLRSRRALAFLRLLPEAVDLMVRAVRSGLPVSEAIALIAEEVDDPVGEVFREVTSNLRIGMALEEALFASLERIDVQEYRFLVVSIALQRETGGNLAEILHNLGAMIRRREQTKLKVKAMSSEARASAMIIGSLPFIMTLVIYVINPDYIMTLFTDPRGLKLLAFGLLSMGIGVFVITRMVRFEI